MNDHSYKFIVAPTSTSGAISFALIIFLLLMLYFFATGITYDNEGFVCFNFVAIEK